ncbi:uncharacterized protein PSFLO_02036 [Pseudozyma flocculosa]|nr:uncharacterized protein PSFLO_02036 [Pseudozyma flocculosa]
MSQPSATAGPSDAQEAPAPIPAPAVVQAPQPPVSIELLVKGNLPRRYNRKGTGEDADTAVVGKGGFGTTYLYERDTSFTPESSLEISAPNSTRPSPNGSPASVTENIFPDPGNAAYGPQGGSDHLPRSRQLVFTPASNRSSTLAAHLRPFADRRPATPRVVVVKMCRTPCTGSFDELQKTSALDRKMRKAMMQDPSLSHIRVVRGEGRILRYLQAANDVEPSAEDANLVLLLADLPVHGKAKAAALDGDAARGCPLTSIEIEPDFSEGPPTRLLVFERLVEIDAELTDKGWEVSKDTWPAERVERMALEIIQGLKFLHRHNVTHGDLKPSNLMKDPATGCVKIIDLGASRRFVDVSNREKDNLYAVDQGDIEHLRQGRVRPTLALDRCEGLSSLTGSPHYMAPEILLQASRYADHKGRARSVLEDWEPHYKQYFTATEVTYFELALSDLKRGWGIRADMWSWSRTVSSLFLKTVPSEDRPSSSSVCPFDFSFSKHQEDFVEALHTPARAEQEQPRFHLWSRHFPLYIVSKVLDGIELPESSKSASPELQRMLLACLAHQDSRPDAETIFRVLTERRTRSHQQAGRMSPSKRPFQSGGEMLPPPSIRQPPVPTLGEPGGLRDSAQAPPAPPKDWMSASREASRHASFRSESAAGTQSLAASTGYHHHSREPSASRSFIGVRSASEQDWLSRPRDRDKADLGFAHNRTLPPPASLPSRTGSGSLLFSDLNQTLVGTEGSRCYQQRLGEQHAAQTGRGGLHSSMHPSSVNLSASTLDPGIIHRPFSVQRPGCIESAEMLDGAHTAAPPGFELLSRVRPRCSSTQTAPLPDVPDVPAVALASGSASGFATMPARQDSWPSNQDHQRATGGRRSRGGASVYELGSARNDWGCPVSSSPALAPPAAPTRAPPKSLMKLLRWAIPSKSSSSSSSSSSPRRR